MRLRTTRPHVSTRPFPSRRRRAFAGVPSVHLFHFRLHVDRPSGCTPGVRRASSGPTSGAEAEASGRRGLPARGASHLERILRSGSLGNTTTQVVETVRSNPQQLYMDITSGTVSIDQQVEAIKSIGGSVPKTTITDTAQKTYEEAKAVFKAPAML